MIASILSILLNIENTNYLIDIYYKKWRYIKYPIYIHRNIRRKWKWLGNLCNLNNNQNKLEDLFKFQSKYPEKSIILWTKIKVLDNKKKINIYTNL